MINYFLQIHCPDCNATKWTFAIIGFLGGSLSVYIIQSIVKSIKFNKDSKKVYNFIKSGLSNHDFRTTKAIASATDLTVGRVEEICAKHPLIKQSTGIKDGLWTLR